MFISSKKSNSIILSIVATGDLRENYYVKLKGNALTDLCVIPPTLGMLLVCCLVRANDKVL